MGDAAKILIVCTGNICRSPFIERLLQLELDQGGPRAEPGITVHSAGTSALVGWPMDAQAAEQLVAHGGDPSGFSARNLTPALIAESDLVLTATREHRGKAARMSPSAMRRVFTFCDFADLVDGLDEPDGPFTNPVGPTDPRARIRRLTEKAAASRGLKPPLAPGQVDIVDPYRRHDEVFAAMAKEIVELMPTVVRALSG
jgi:protein-tyrosine phosphatase